LLDITERKQIEVARAQLLAREQEVRLQAEMASRMKDEFLAIVSHELRSPLNAILGWARLLRIRNLDAEKVNQALEVIERNAKAQTQLIEDLLDISRIVRGKVRLYAQPTNLSAVINAALDTVRPTAEAKNIKLAFNQAEAAVSVWVSGDPDRLQQVVWNLLSNAIRFTPEGGRVQVCLSQATEANPPTTNGEHLSDYAQIQVIDTGKGIDPEFLPFVFERFRQADSSTTRTHGGLGLGLAIVRNLVELHGGSIQVASQGEGQGATFTVRLPLLKPGESRGNDPTFSAQQSGVTNGTGAGDITVSQPIRSCHLSSLQVLVVDDELDTREFMTTVLEQAGATVIAVDSAAAAMRSMQQQLPDVLVSDISMPEQDGYMLIRQIRALPPEQRGQLPAIAITAYAREEDRMQAIAAGFHLHVAKPIDPTELVSVVATLAGLGQNC
jgi:signal transduction histidine kinase/CheY-like chemotaxis protein